MERSRCANAQGGFTLVELLIVIAIIGVLLTLFLPAVQLARESSRRCACTNRLRQVGVALHALHLANEEFPAGSYQHATRRIAWSAFLLPHIEQMSIWEQLDVELPFNSIQNYRATQHVVSTFLCPSATTIAMDRVGGRTNDRNGNGLYDVGDWMGVTDYGGVFGTARVMPLGNGALLYNRALNIGDFTDGTSHTVIVAEDTGRGRHWHGEWVNGNNLFDQFGKINVNPNNEIFSDHPQGANVLFCGSAVAFLGASIDDRVVDALLTRAHGEVIEADDF